MDYKNILKTFKEQRNKKWDKRAEKYYDDPESTDTLLNKAEDKASKKEKGPIKEIWDKLKLLIALARDWSKGNYREISKGNMILILAGIIYFVSPLDIVPDFLVGLGFLDDAAILTFVVNRLDKELEKYRGWKSNFFQGV